MSSDNQYHQAPSYVDHDSSTSSFCRSSPHHSCSFTPRQRKYSPQLLTMSTHYLPNTLADASVAFYRTSKRDVQGNIRTLAIRRRLQQGFDRLEFFLHQHRSKVIVLGFLVLGLLCLGLKNVKLETNVEKLWMEDSGRLKSEMEYIPSIIDGEKELGSFATILQTGSNLMNKYAINDHLRVLLNMKHISVTVGKWSFSLNDICSKMPLIHIPHRRSENLLNQLNPCVITTPLDCFWDGAKVAGPEEAVQITKNTYVTWKNLDPAAYSRRYPYLKMLFQMMGHGYTDRHCINPFAPDCPKTAPNYNTTGMQYGQILAGGCPSFMPKLYNHSESLFIGGVSRSSEKHIQSAKALQSIVALNSPRHIRDQLIQRIQHSSYTEDFTLLQAEQVLRDWKVELKKMLHKDNIMMKSGSQFYSLGDDMLIGLLNQTTRNPNPTHLVGVPLIIVVYTTFCFLRWKETVISHCWLALAGCAIVSLSVVAGLGVSAFLLVQFNVITVIVLPYIMIGLGMNDILTLTLQHARLVKKNPNKEMIGKTLQFCGPSIMYTSLCCMAAFIFGAVIPVPLMRNFCIQAAIITLIQTVSVILIFPALLSLDLSRRINQRLDLFCCLSDTSCSLASNSMSRACAPSHTSIPVLSTHLSTAPVTSIYSSTASSESSSSRVHYKSPPTNLLEPSTQILMSQECCSSQPYQQQHCNKPQAQIFNSPPMCDNQHKDSLTFSKDRLSTSEMDGKRWHSLHLNASLYWNKLSVHRFFAEWYSSFLMRLPVRVFVIVAGAGIFAVSIYGAIQIQMGLHFATAVPDGSMEQSFIQATEANFGVYPFELVTKKLDYPKNQGLIRKYYHSFRDVEYIMGAEQEREIPLDRSPANYHRSSDPRKKNRPTDDNYGKKNSNMVFWLDELKDWLKSVQDAYDYDVKHGYIWKRGNWSKKASPKGILGLYLLVQTGDIHFNVDIERLNKHRLVENNIIDEKAFYIYLRAWRRVDSVSFATLNVQFYPEPDDGITTGPMNLPPEGNHENIYAMPMARDIEFTNTHLNMIGVKDTIIMIDVVKRIREITDTFAGAGIPNYPNGLPFRLCEQYFRLPQHLGIALTAAVVVHFIVSFAFLANLWSAILASLGVALSLVQTAGILGLLPEYHLNATSAGLLVAASIGWACRYQGPVLLAFVTSIAAPCESERRSRIARVKAALGQAGPSVWHSGVTGFLSCCFMAFTPITFVRLYFFRLLSLIIVSNLFNSLVLLPTLLSFMGPFAEVRPFDNGRYNMSAATPPPSPRLNASRGTYYQSSNTSHCSSSNNNNAYQNCPASSNSFISNCRCSRRSSSSQHHNHQCNQPVVRDQPSVEHTSHPPPVASISHQHQSVHTGSDNNYSSESDLRLSTISEEPSHLSSTASLNSAMPESYGSRGHHILDNCNHMQPIVVVEPEIVVRTTPIDIQSTYFHNHSSSNCHPQGSTSFNRRYHSTPESSRSRSSRGASHNRQSDPDSFTPGEPLQRSCYSTTDYPLSSERPNQSTVSSTTTVRLKVEVHSCNQPNPPQQLRNVPHYSGSSRDSINYNQLNQFQPSTRGVSVHHHQSRQQGGYSHLPMHQGMSQVPHSTGRRRHSADHNPSYVSVISPPTLLDPSDSSPPPPYSGE